MNVALLFWIVASVPFLPFTIQSGNSGLNCPCNQTATECTPCDQFCNQPTRSCTAMCRANNTCRCENGYLRMDAHSNHCVLEKDCPPPKRTCPRNQTATECTPCDQFCNQEGRACTKICIKNSTCGCEAEYFRVDPNSDRCLLKKDCPVPKPTHQCPVNQTATDCAPCNSVCNLGPRACPLYCLVNSTLCKCDEGYLQVDMESNICVLENDCPPPKPSCPRNQTATECTPCDQFCNQEGRVCTDQCIKNSTCRCDSGYLRADANGAGGCVLKKDCPAPKPTHQCPANQTVTACSPCNQVCNGGPKVCSQACTENPTFCQCANGYVLSDGNSNRCILKKDCPAPNSCSPPEQPCAPGEKYTTCGSCDGNCTVPDPACTLQCRVGCFCAQGNVRNGQGMCIPKWKCPKNCSPAGQ